MGDIENPLLTTIDTVDKKGKSKKMWWRKPTLLLFQKKNIDTVEKTDKSQTSKKQSLPPKQINPTHLTQ